MLKNLLIGCGVCAALGATAVFLLLVYIGLFTPDTKVLPGSKVPSSFVTDLRELGALEEEELLYFYSDGFLSLREGSYLLTDRAVVVYIEDEIDPPLRVPLGQVESIEFERDSSWAVDSDVFLNYDGGEEGPLWVYFPLSSEEGGDRRFVEELSQRSGAPIQDMTDEDEDGESGN